MQDKLRAAELELSVERAKIAREKSQLADLQAEIDSRHVDGRRRQQPPATIRRNGAGCRSWG